MHFGTTDPTKRLIDTKAFDLVRFFFFGGFRVFDQHGVERRFPIVKGAALIAYIALSHWGRASRGELTALLWSESSENVARTALRQCLYQMKGVLADIDPGLITVSPNAVVLNRDRLQCDTDGLFLTSACQLPNARFDPDSLLRGFEDLDPAYDEWLQVVRGEAGRRLQTTLLGIMEDQRAARQERLRAAAWMHQLDPSNENAARLLIEEAAGRGDQVEMLKVYSALWNELDEGWGEEPSTALQAFVGEARAKLNRPAIAHSKIGRKYLTILAVTLATKEDASQEPEEIAAARATMIAQARRIISSNGGIMLGASEEGLRAAFGMPLAGEMDASNAVESALALRQEIVRFPGLGGGIGLDSGVLLVEETAGDDVPKVVGPSNDRAISLSHRNHQGKIYAAERTIRRLRGNYLTSVNHDEPAIVLIVGRNADIDPVIRSEGRYDFVGRKSFLANLERIWSDVSQSSSLRVVNIQGPAGIGKTRLADEFLQRLEDRRVLTARAVCDRYNRSAPLDPIRALIASYCGTGSASTERSSDNGTLSSGAKLPPASEMARRLVDSIAGRASVMMLDDWQWADDATRMTLSRIAAAPRGTCLLILLTSRDTQYQDPLVEISHQIMLPNMTLREVEAKAALHLDGPLERQTKEQIFSRSGGNPLYLEEICHALTGPRAVGRSDRTLEALPANMLSLIASRIERLPVEDISILFAAAVHGDRIEPEILSAVIRRDVPETTYQRLCDEDILAPWNHGEKPRFKHGITREVAYGMIPLERRRELHLAYADHLQSSLDADQDVTIAEKLAWHYGGGGHREQAFHYERMSGDKALAASALDHAMLHFGAAMELIAGSTEKADRHRWVSVALRWAIPSIYAASPDHLSVLLRAEALANEIDDREASCQARYWVGYLHFVLGDHAQALESLRAAGRVAGLLHDGRMIAEAQAVEGCVLAALARYEEAGETMRTAIAAKERRPMKHGRVRVTSVYARANLAMTVADRGEFDEAEQLLDEALQKVEGYEHEVESSVLNFSAAIHIWRGNWKHALDQAIRSRERSERVSSPYLMGMSRCIWGYAHWRHNGEDEGINVLFRAATFMRERGMGLYLSFVYGWLAEAFAETGRHEDAHEAWQGAMQRAESGEIAGGCMACRAVAQCDLAQGQLNSAAAQLRLAEEFAERRNSPHEKAANHLLAARLRTAEGKSDDAAEHLAMVRAIGERLGLSHRLKAANELAQSLTVNR